MSSLHRGDQHLHHADGSHRWSGGPPDPRGQQAYLAALRDHLRQHRSRFAGATEHAGSSRPRPRPPGR